MNEIRQGDIFRIETISKCIKRAYVGTSSAGK